MLHRICVLVLLVAGCLDEPEIVLEEPDAVDATPQVAHPIRDTTNAFLAVVKVNTWRGMCSGTLIGADSVLTSAHCFCTENFVKSNTCRTEATVTFRPDPADPLHREVTRTGTATVKSDYNPAWTQQLLEEDLAVISLDGVAPPYVSPIRVAQTYLPVGVAIIDVGYGLTGGNCDGNQAGELFWGIGILDSYETAYHNRESIQFDDITFCSGDSGGPVLNDSDPVRARVHAVNSSTTWSPAHGYINHATTTTQHFNWITGNVCRSSRTNSCTGWGDPCACTARNNIMWQSTSGVLRIWVMAGGLIQSTVDPFRPGAPWQIEGHGDFNGDGEDDVLWRSSTSGEVLVATMHDNQFTGFTSVGTPTFDWRIQGVGDLDGDGRADILWRNTAGQVTLWFAGSPAGGVGLGSPVGLDSRIVGLGDFNHDGRSDIVWQNGAQLTVWLMNGGIRLGQLTPAPIASGWSLQGIGDLDGDLASDLVFRHTNGAVSVWFDGDPGHGGGVSYQNAGAPVDTGWTLRGVADFDTDGRDDLLWQSTTNGQVAVWIMDGARVIADLYPAAADPSWSIKAINHNRGF